VLLSTLWQKQIIKTAKYFCASKVLRKRPPFGRAVAFCANMGGCPLWLWAFAHVSTLMAKTNNKKLKNIFRQ